MKSQTENKCAKFTVARLTEPSSFFKRSSSSERKKVVKYDYICIQIDTEHSDTLIHTVLYNCALCWFHSVIFTVCTHPACLFTPLPLLVFLSPYNLCSDNPPTMLHSTFSFIHTLGQCASTSVLKRNSLIRRTCPSNSVYNPLTSLPLLLSHALSHSSHCHTLPSFLRLIYKTVKAKETNTERGEVR